MSTQHQGIFLTRKKSSVIITTAEKKILFVLFYYVILGMMALVYYGFTIADIDLYVEALETYFRCEALGHLPNETSQCDPKQYQQYIYPEIYSTSNYLTAFLTTANLTFVVNWSTIAKFWSTIAKFCSQYYNKKENSSNVMFPNTNLTLSSNATVTIK